MKLLASLALSATALAAVIPQQAPLGSSIVHNTQQTKYLIELAPYQTRWVTEEEKWALKLVGDDDRSSTEKAKRRTAIPLLS